MLLRLVLLSLVVVWLRLLLVRRSGGCIRLLRGVPDCERARAGSAGCARREGWGRKRTGLSSLLRRERARQAKAGGQRDTAREGKGRLATLAQVAKSGEEGHGLRRRSAIISRKGSWF